VGIVNKGNQEIGERRVIPQFQARRIDPAFEIVVEIAARGIVGLGAVEGTLWGAASGAVCVSEGVGGHEVSKASKVSGAAPAPLESFAGLMVPGGSGRHQLSIPRRTDNVPS